VSVEGNYFKVNYRVNITLTSDSAVKAVLATNVPTNATGGFNITVTIPFCTSPGEYKINATDGINSKATGFEVLGPSITIDPVTARVGETIIVEGKLFRDIKPGDYILLNQERWSL